MSEQLTHVLLIEDNPGDADLVRLRLEEGRSVVDVNYADNRLLSKAADNAELLDVIRAALPNDIAVPVALPS